MKGPRSGLVSQRPRLGLPSHRRSVGCNSLSEAGADFLRTIKTKDKMVFSACTAFVISNMDKVNISLAIIPMAQVSA